MFSCGFCKISNAFFTEHLWATASEEVKTSKVPLIRRNYWGLFKKNSWNGQKWFHLSKVPFYWGSFDRESTVAFWWINKLTSQSKPLLVVLYFIRPKSAVPSTISISPSTLPPKNISGISVNQMSTASQQAPTNTRSLHCLLWMKTKNSLKKNCFPQNRGVLRTLSGIYHAALCKSG